MKTHILQKYGSMIFFKLINFTERVSENDKIMNLYFNSKKFLFFIIYKRLIYYEVYLPQNCNEVLNKNIISIFSKHFIKFVETRS